MTTAEDGRRLRTCPLCEAMCGLEIHVDGGKVTNIRGNRDDVWSHGHLCPKACHWPQCTTTRTASAAR
jgi:anaerobic selenocysteine-containing dehydrogenase